MSDKFENIPTDDSWMKRAELYANNKAFYERNLNIWIKVLSKIRNERRSKSRSLRENRF